MYVTALNTFASWSFKRHMCMKKHKTFSFFLNVSTVALGCLTTDNWLKFIDYESL